MALKMILNKQTDFTGEFPAEYATPVCGDLTSLHRMKIRLLPIPPAMAETLLL